MAQELDPQLLQCDAEDGRLAVAFTHWYYPGPQAIGPEWAALCQPCLDRAADNDDLYYVRFRAAPADHGSGHDPITTTPDDLKPDGERADNNDP